MVEQGGLGCGQFCRSGLVWPRVGAGQEQGPKARGGRAKLGPLPRPLALGVCVLWLALTLVALAQLLAGPSLWSGARELLVPESHRSPRERALALVEVDFEALAAREGDESGLDSLGADTDPRTILAEAGFAVEEALADAREPLAPPKTEITRWLDAHVLYLLPVETHGALRERLSDEHMRSQVQGLHARLSSPLFSVSGEQPRRDPLGIHELGADAAGRLGHVAELPGSDAAQVGANGDLLAARGDRALIALRAERPAQELEAALTDALAQLPVRSTLIDARAEEARMAAELGERWLALALGCLAALVLLLAVFMRRVAPVLVLGACLSSVWLVFVWLATGLELGGWGLAGLDSASLALSLVALAVGCDAALRLPTISARAWVAPLALAAAASPLLLTPYPLWRSWALWWFVAQLLLALVMKLVFPALLELLRGDFEWRHPGFRLTPLPVVAALVCVGLGAAGIWTHADRDYRSLARLPILDPLTQSHERELLAHFFDPTMLVEARSVPGDAPAKTEAELRGEAEISPEAEALAAAATTSAALAGLVPDAARRVDSPGSFVIAQVELEARREALSELGLDTRMEVLGGQLEDQGLRAEAFAEFVRGAADVDELPSAQAALDGPLGPWIRAYLHGEGDEVELRTRVELRGRDGLMTPALSEAELAELPELRGPAIAALVDQREATPRLLVSATAGLWLSALLIWLGTSRLSTALASVLVGASTQLGLGFGLAMLGEVRGPHTLPVVLIVGVTAALAAARACEAARRDEPILAQGLLLAGGCQIVVGLIMLAGSAALWRELGLCLALGSALGCGLGLFVGPGLARLARGLDRGRA